ncbi:zinc finger protein 711-like [Leptopilina boulardi]|uniref:zinc finger protein 711-like n=1 Tax=Leptopilina boulardi TaxID=63433 RepID=UPI0021F53A4A|nr:zinc finger protein 711-like [Leptopilina boulardi]
MQGIVRNISKAFTTWITPAQVGIEANENCDNDSHSKDSLEDENFTEDEESDSDEVSLTFDTDPCPMVTTPVDATSSNLVIPSDNNTNSLDKSSMIRKFDEIFKKELRIILERVNECNKCFDAPEELFVHLEVEHSSISIFNCHLCKILSYSPEELILHYEEHGDCKYQCVNSKTNTHSHISPQQSQCIQEPVLLEKSSPQLTKLKSDIDQLLLLNPDEHYSWCSDLIAFINLPDESLDSNFNKSKIVPDSTSVEDVIVPESVLTNSSSSLEKQEKIFDKIVNFASSSHQNECKEVKQKETVIQTDEKTLPKYVPENKRFVCGFSKCSYLSVNENTLRSHLKTLHSDEQFFKCTHCKEQKLQADNISMERMGIHLKMHDSKLYKCSYCNYFHYKRHKVDRHLDKHVDHVDNKRPFVEVVREFESNKSSLEENKNNTPNPEENLWKCNNCDYHCVYKAEILAHASNEHNEKNQFKCTACSYKTNIQIGLDWHLISKHPYEPEADFQMVYQKIEGTKKFIDLNEHQGTSEESFDSLPLWRRDLPQTKHIRSILNKDDSHLEISGSAVLTPENCKKRKSDSDLPSKVAKIKLDESNEQKIGKFGPYGNPEEEFYVCPICKKGKEYRTKHKQNMKFHLFKDLKYFRYECLSCIYESVNVYSMKIHCARGNEKKHRGKVSNFETLPINDEIEEWVHTLLERQGEKIQKYKNDKSEMDNINENCDKRDYVFKCKYCWHEFPSKRGVKIHVTKQHLMK